MLQPNHLLDAPRNWDTEWARKFLRIPQDQLKKIENLSEWSANKILTHENTICSEISTVTTVNVPLPKSALVPEKISLSFKNCEIPQINSVQQTTNLNKLDFLTVENTVLSRSASISCLNIPDTPLNLTNSKPSSSVPNNKELVLSSVSAEQSKIPVTDVQNPQISTFPRSHLNPIGDRIKDKIMVSIESEMDILSTSFSQPEMKTFKSSSKINRPIEKLEDNILNHKYLKGSMNSSDKESDEAAVSNIVIQEGIKQNPLLDKRLMLLEKRFSPCKEHSLLPVDENSKQDSQLGKTEGQEFSTPVFKTPKEVELPQVQNKVPDAVCSADDVLNKDHISVTQNTLQESEVNKNLCKNKDAPKDKHIHDVSQCVIPTDHAKNEESTSLNASNESFLSQPIPCGQPLPVDTNSTLQPSISETASVKVVNDELTRTTTNVDVSSITKNSEESIKMQNSLPADVQGSCTKRKRKSKTETPKRLKHAKKVDIHFTSDQVRNMLEIMRMFHSEA